MNSNFLNDADAGLNALVTQAMADARAAQSRWSLTPPAGRRRLIRELRRLIAENALPLAEASASARGRPALESMTTEVLPLTEACRFLERQAGRILAARRLGRRGLPIWLTGVHAEVHREPIGVVLIIGPGNYPLLLPGVQLVQALAAGNAVLLKPGIGGSPVARVLTGLLVRAGFDPRLVALLPESPEAARAAILTRPDKVLFTGSAATGEKILAQLAPHLIPATMELSGCDAVLVRADADLDLTVKALSFALVLNGGATCMSPKRVFVHQSIAAELQGRLARAFRAGENPSLPTSAAAKNLRPLIEDALARGAHFIAGGEQDGAAIILGGVASASRLLREDLFASVLAIVSVTDDLEAVLRANDCPFALGAGIFSRDESAARSLAARLNAGVITINDLLVPTADARGPFGGRGRSGFGVTRGAEGLLELTAPKMVTVSRGKFRPAYMSPQPGDGAIYSAYLELTHGRGLKSRWAALVSLVRGIIHRFRSTGVRSKKSDN